MNKLQELISRGSCSQCGQGVYLDDSDGRIACSGCQLATEECNCAGEASPSDAL